MKYEHIKDLLITLAYPSTLRFRSHLDPRRSFRKQGEEWQYERSGSRRSPRASRRRDKPIYEDTEEDRIRKVASQRRRDLGKTALIVEVELPSTDLSTYVTLHPGKREKNAYCTTILETEALAPTGLAPGYRLQSINGRRVVGLRYAAIVSILETQVAPLKLRFRGPVDPSKLNSNRPQKELS